MSEQRNKRRDDSQHATGAVMTKQLFRKKPVVVEAMQYTRESCPVVSAWVYEATNDHPADIIDGCCGVEPLIIQTLEGEMTAQPGDWIIKGVNGEFYPCKPDIFEKTYEPV
jgi:hypothetical protein